MLTYIALLVQWTGSFVSAHGMTSVRWFSLDTKNTNEMTDNIIEEVLFLIKKHNDMWQKNFQIMIKKEKRGKANGCQFIPVQDAWLLYSAVWATKHWQKYIIISRAELMLVGRMCGVSLKDRRHSMDLYSLLGVWGVADGVRYDRLRWFGHLERKGVDEWVLACGNVEVAGVRCVGRSRKTWGVWKMTWNCMGCSLNGQCSEICAWRDFIHGVNVYPLA